MTAELLQLRAFGIAFGDQIVVTDVTLSLPELGTTTLLGPVDSGKSTFLRSLAGYNDAIPSHRTWGEAYFAGRPLAEGNRPALMQQKARLLLDSVLENLASGLPERESLTRSQQKQMAQRLLERCQLSELQSQLDSEVISLPLAMQRRLAIARTVASNPRMICLDEPTADLPAADIEPLLQLIQLEGTRRAVLVVTHNQQHARQIADRVVLLAGGRVWEAGPAQQLFTKPRTTMLQQYLRTGSCVAPNPNTPIEELSEEFAELPLPPPIPATVVSQAFGPNGFHWLKPGLLAGTPRPGIIHQPEYDLEALRRVGIRVLVTLEEQPYPAELLQAFNFESVWVPIPDMAAPTQEQAVDLCRTIERLIAEGKPVAVHCRAGLGRTGTILATQLIWEGAAAHVALEQVRKIEPRWVQSEEQVRHLKSFAAFRKSFTESR